MKCAMGVLFLAALLLPGTPAAAKELVELPAGRVYEVLADKDAATLWIALVPMEGVTPGELSIASTPFDVAVGNRHEVSLLTRFSARLALQEGYGPGIELEVKLRPPPATGATPAGTPPQQGSTLASGTYDVHLALRRAVKGGTTETQTLKLQIIVPRAQLRVLSPPLIENVIGLLGTIDQSAAPFVFSETSMKSRVTQLQAAPLTPPAPASAPLTGTLAVDTPPSIRPGEVVTARYAPSGAFPLGSVKGTVQLSAPQLEEPLAVSYEVRTRRTKTWILVLLGLGLIAGYVVRVWLKYRIDLGEKQVELETLHQRIRTELGSRPDRALQDELRAALALLDGARRDSVKELTERLPEAEQRFTKALETFKVTLADTKAKLEELTKLLDANWELPTSARGVTQRCREELLSIQTALDESNATGAERRLNELKSRCGKELASVLSPWRAQALHALEALRSAELPLPRSGAEASEAQRSSLEAALKQIPVDSPTLDPRALLDRTHEAAVALRELARSLGSQIRLVLQGVHAALTELRVREALSLEPVIQLWSHIPSTEAGEELEWIARHATGATSALDQALKPYFSPEEYASLLAKRDYLAEVRRMAQQRLGPEGVTLGEKHPPVEKPGTEETAPTPAAQRPRVPTPYLRGGTEQPPSAMPQELRYRTTLASLFRAKAARFGLSGIGIVAIGYLLFEPQFVGTPQDLATIFFWGFTIDVSVDALMAAVAKRAKPAGT